jgi:hypothetical protein
VWISWLKSILALSIILAVSTADHAAARKGGVAPQPGQTGFAGKPALQFREPGKLQPASPKALKQPDAWTAKKMQPLNPKPPKSTETPVAREVGKKPKNNPKGQRCVRSHNNCQQSCKDQHKHPGGFEVCSFSCISIFDRCLTKANPK